jgi:hypothetical protein
MLINLLIVLLFVGTIYVYIHKYCTHTSATQCSTHLLQSFFNVLAHLFKIIVKFISAAINIVRENPYTPAPVATSPSVPVPKKN